MFKQCPFTELSVQSYGVVAPEIAPFCLSDQRIPSRATFFYLINEFAPIGKSHCWS